MLELIEHPRGHAFPAPPPHIETPPDLASPPPQATRMASGLVYLVLSPGRGTVHPSASSRVRVHYTGWTTDGHVFDSSITRGEPAEFPLSGVIPGWTEAVPLMVEGERARFWMPPALGYGEHPRPGIPAGTLVFEIELLAILP
ncbi:MAG: FKBP-type peptidyl-prolyl cis-trans isomerase [Sandaracinaceae bacterium]|nr:FKBP-type peptidyl-prolyl cis-trans isomerase [Sandaracinaceae bacterium]